MANDISLLMFKAEMKLAEEEIAQFAAKRLTEIQRLSGVEITGININLITVQTVDEPVPAIAGATSTIYFEI